MGRRERESGEICAETAVRPLWRARRRSKQRRGGTSATPWLGRGEGGREPSPEGWRTPSRELPRGPWRAPGNHRDWEGGRTGVNSVAGRYSSGPATLSSATVARQGPWRETTADTQGGRGKWRNWGGNGKVWTAVASRGAGLRQCRRGKSTLFPQGGREKWRNLDGKGTLCSLAPPDAVEAAPGRDIGNTVAWKGGRGTNRGFYRSCAGRASVRNLQRGTI